ncbi:MAG: hypothetical protein NG747_02095 [Candidatus Brocadia sp.]|nr:hypothetical protein [Candidatus Brocadia sp.]
MKPNDFLTLRMVVVGFHSRSTHLHNLQPGRVGIAYHVFRIYMGNLCGCGMNEMDGNDFGMERIMVMMGP